MTPKRNIQRCRLCLSVSSKCIDVTVKGKHKLSKNISEMFNFEITPTDVLSTKVCLTCIKGVKLFYVFFRKVKNAQTYLYDELLKINKPEDLSNDQKDICLDQTDTLEQQITQLDNDSNILPNFLNDIQIKEELFDVDSDRVELDENKSSNYNFDSEDETKLIFITQKYSNEKNRKSKKKKKNSTNIINEDAFESNSLHEDDEIFTNLEETVHRIDDLNNLNFKNIEKSSPIELFKNGKLVIKGKSLDNLMANFYKFKCTLCVPGAQFDLLDSMFKHYENEHGTKGYVTCCNKKLFRRKAAFEHMRKHVQPLAFQCPICQKVLSRPHLLREHLTSHLPESEKPRKCTHCDKRYTCYSGLKNHMLSHLPQESRDLFKCSHCDKQFSNKSSFKMHLVNVHTTPKHLCSICGKKFKTIPSLTYHLTTHDNQTKMCCKECGFIAKNKQTLKNHLVTHSNVMLHCDKCEYTTLLKRSLSNHMKMKHSDNKPFQCSFCQKCFKTKKILEIHTVQHTGERKFSCKYCSKTFASSGNKSTHMKRMHSLQQQQEVKAKQQIYYSVLEVQLNQEKEELKSQALARQHLKDLEGAFRNPLSSDGLTIS